MQVIKAAFVSSLPVLMGYLAMGAAAGILLSSEIRSPDVTVFAFFSSAINISGALQFILVDWVKEEPSLAAVALLTFCLNLRYALYGFSLIQRFQGINPLKKGYLIWTLTDETYALQVENKVPPGCSSLSYCLGIAAFDHAYWIAGVMLGALLGTKLPADTEGIDFAMTALFIVILVEQCTKSDNRHPALIGGAAAVLSRCFFPVDSMLIPAIAVMLTVFLIGRRFFERPAEE